MPEPTPKPTPPTEADVAAMLKTVRRARAAVEAIGPDALAAAIDSGAAPGDLLPALARLLRKLRDRERGEMPPVG